MTVHLPIFHYWDRERIPDDVMRNFASFRDRNPELPHLIFSRKTAETMIGEHFTDREVAAFRACAVPAMQADYFRYCAAYALGGVYVDADLSCKCALKSLIDQAGTFIVRPPKHPLPVNTAFFCFTSPRHPLPRLVLDVATSNIERRTSENIAWVTGPSLMLALSALHRLGSLDDALLRFRGPRMQPLIRLVASVAGDQGGIDRAFGDVGVLPRNRLSEWISSSRALEYKESDTHWLNWQDEDRSIFT